MVFGEDLAGPLSEELSAGLAVEDVAPNEQATEGVSGSQDTEE